MLHNTRYRQGKSRQKSSPSALSDAEVPSPVSPLSDVPGRRPKRLWNFSDTAGVCHSMSANRANVDLRNRTMAEERKRRRSTSTHAELTQFFVHFDCIWVSTYPLVWIQYISVRLSFHTRQCHLIEMRKNMHHYIVQTHTITLPTWQNDHRPNSCKYQTTYY